MPTRGRPLEFGAQAIDWGFGATSVGGPHHPIGNAESSGQGQGVLALACRQPGGEKTEVAAACESPAGGVSAPVLAFLRGAGLPPGSRHAPKPELKASTSVPPRSGLQHTPQSPSSATAVLPPCQPLAPSTPAHYKSSQGAPCSYRWSNIIIIIIIRRSAARPLTVRRCSRCDWKCPRPGKDN